MGSSIEFSASSTIGSASAPLIELVQVHVGYTALCSFSSSLPHAHTHTHTDYCMVNFVKPDLLGTIKEFRNRFANPIRNGQHRDSEPSDVILMKQRAHVLHKVLSGCVDVRDD